MPNKNITSAVDRLFRSYDAYTGNASEDTLFALLTALHSLDDRLETTKGRLFFEIPEYVALKALRNHFHHGGEVRYALRVKALAGELSHSDLLHACLIATADCTAAIEGAKDKYREGVRQAFETTAMGYGTVADINPCIFNCVVKIYEKLQGLELAGDSDAFAEFSAQYAWETANGYSHYVSGTILTHPARVSNIPAAMEHLYNSAL